MLSPAKNKTSFGVRKVKQMKKMTCIELGGACNEEFHAETFEEMAKLSKEHGQKMMEEGDQDHLNAMQKLMSELTTPEAMQQWMSEKEQAFEAAAEI